MSHRPFFAGEPCGDFFIHHGEVHLPPYQTRLKSARSNSLPGRRQALYPLAPTSQPITITAVFHCGVALTELAYPVALAAVRRGYLESLLYKSRARPNRHLQPTQSSLRRPSLRTAGPTRFVIALHNPGGGQHARKNN